MDNLTKLPPMPYSMEGETPGVVVIFGLHGNGLTLLLTHLLCASKEIARESGFGPDDFSVVSNYRLNCADRHWDGMGTEVIANRMSPGVVGLDCMDFYTSSRYSRIASVGADKWLDALQESGVVIVGTVNYIASLASWVRSSVDVYVKPRLERTERLVSIPDQPTLKRLAVDCHSSWYLNRDKSLGNSLFYQKPAEVRVYKDMDRYFDKYDTLEIII